ncbi:hypothetical protein [Roseomonas indoligenes]|uniref:Uncharacterized protein n=1 Tax=Roseomonas indoligenes TaxID=2820811 RepID=A0A940SA45_9PROT|nr:hypothetical protein [Pararoseomonas indoligenes]MBP0495807.1 hypothetical protein [Pararoseomonas indoligenes]
MAVMDHLLVQDLSLQQRLTMVEARLADLERRFGAADHEILKAHYELISHFPDFVEAARSRSKVKAAAS